MYLRPVYQLVMINLVHYSCKTISVVTKYCLYNYYYQLTILFIFK